MEFLHKPKIPSVLRREKRPASLVTGTAMNDIWFPSLDSIAYTLCLDNGSNSGTGYLTSIETVFTLQLRGPFNGGVWAGLSPVSRSLYQRFDVYSSSSQSLTMKLGGL
jgi:hypothetical protein